MNKKHLVYFLISFTYFLAACTKESEPDTAEFSYVPLETGRYIIYQVEKITYTLTDTVTEDYFLKEQTADIINAGDENRYRLERFIKNDINENWSEIPDSVWSIYNAMNRIVKVENNVRFIKLLFPVEENKTWNGNAENHVKEEIYKMTLVKHPHKVDSLEFGNTVTVVQEDVFNKVQKRYKAEIFAKDVGLIEKVIEQYEYKEANAIEDPYKIKSGVKYTQKIIGYGKN